VTVVTSKGEKWDKKVKRIVESGKYGHTVETYQKKRRLNSRIDTAIHLAYQKLKSIGLAK
jgi:hypothetical protein